MKPRLDLRGAALPRPASALTVLWLAMVMLVSAPVWQRTEQWLGWLPTSVGIAESTAMWAPSLLSLTAAWASGQPRALGLAEWVSSSPRGSAGPVRALALLTGTAGLAGQLTVLAAILVASVRGGMTTGGLTGWTLVMSVPTVSAYLLFWVVVGTRLGHGLPGSVAAPIAALMPYVIYSALTLYFADGPLNVLAVGDPRVYDYVLPTASSLVTRLLFWVMATATITASLFTERRRARVSVWATSISAAGALFVGPAVENIPRAESPVCVGTMPVTCLDRSHATTMTRYRTAIAGLWPSIPPPLRPDAIGADARLIPAGSPSSLVVPPVAGHSEPSRIIDPEMFAARMGVQLFLAPCSSARPQGLDTALALDLWWRMGHGVPIDGTAFPGDANLPATDAHFVRHAQEARDFDALPALQRNEWFTEHASAVRTCSSAGLPG